MKQNSFLTLKGLSVNIARPEVLKHSPKQQWHLRGYFMSSFYIFCLPSETDFMLRLWAIL